MLAQYQNSINYAFITNYGIEIKTISNPHIYLFFNILLSH